MLRVSFVSPVSTSSTVLHISFWYHLKCFQFKQGDFFLLQALRFTLPAITVFFSYIDQTIDHPQF